MEVWMTSAIVIVLGTIAVDRTRAYRFVPATLNRLRRWSRPQSG